MKTLNRPTLLENVQRNISQSQNNLFIKHVKNEQIGQSVAQSIQVNFITEQVQKIKTTRKMH